MRKRTSHSLQKHTKGFLDAGVVCCCDLEGEDVVVVVSAEVFC